MLSNFRVRPYKSKRIVSYQKRMSSPRGMEHNIVDKIMVSILKEQGYSWEEDTSSVYDPQILYDTLARYSPDNDVEVSTDSDSWRRAIAATFKIFAKGKNHDYLNVLHSHEDIMDALKLEKSSGLPAMTSKEDDFWYAINREQQVLLGKKAPSPCIAYKRTQLGGKTRLVWGYPLEMTIMESRFARPLIKHFLGYQTTMAFGQSKFNLGARVERINQSYGQTYGLDFSKFDSTVPRRLIHVAFSILSTWFSPEDLERYGWSQIVKYFVYTPIVMPNGKLYTGKRHGVPSGSYFTQMIDSIVNTLIQFWLSNELGYSLSWENLLVLGDDVLISIPKEVDLTSISEKLLTIGMVMHPDKTKKEAHFLGATWRKGIPYRDTHELLKKMVYPENYRKYPSQDRYERRILAMQLMHQYAASYANVAPMLLKFYASNDMGMVDESSHLIKAHANVEWEKDMFDNAFKHIGLGDDGVFRPYLSTRLFA